MSTARQVLPAQRLDSGVGTAAGTSRGSKEGSRISCEGRSSSDTYLGELDFQVGRGRWPKVQGRPGGSGLGLHLAGHLDLSVAERHGGWMAAWLARMCLACSEGGAVRSVRQFHPHLYIGRCQTAAPSLGGCWEKHLNCN